MTTLLPSLVVAVPLVLVSFAAAQSVVAEPNRDAASGLPSHAASGSSIDSIASLGAEAWRVPIHENEPDAASGRYGIWAAGPGFKVSFHAGAKFHPVLGPEAPRGLPVGWHTEHVAVGAQVLVDARSRVAQHRASDWRFEYRLGAEVVEAYDVRIDGVEQSFVVARPGGAVDGELVVTGRWHTELTPTFEPHADGRAGIRFVADDGRTVVRCGSAIAIDAAGRRTPVSTELDGTETRLRVSAAFVRDAVWPITIDPLLTIATPAMPTHAIVACDCANAPTIYLPRIAAVSIAVSSTDEDLYVWRISSDGAPIVSTYTDLAATVSSRWPSTAYVGTPHAGDWLVAFERATSTSSQIHVRLQDESSVSTGRTLRLALSQPGTTDRRPDLGGSLVGDDALLVYQTDVTTTQANTLATEVRCVFVRPSSESFHDGSIVANAPALTLDRERPCVTPWAGPGNDWIVCWQERTTLFGSGSWYLRGQRIAQSLQHGVDTTIASSAGAREPNLVQPRVDGADEHYCVVVLRGDNDATGTGIVARRFDWPTRAATPNLLWQSNVATEVTSLLTAPHVAHDRYTDSHWGVTFARAGITIRFVNLGFDGTVVHTETVLATAASAANAIAYRNLDSTYEILAQASQGANEPVVYLGWNYPTTAGSTYGNSCVGNFQRVALPVLGTGSWAPRWNGTPPFAPCALLVSPSMTSIDLTALGAPVCTLLVGPNLFSLPTVSDANGIASVGFALTTSMSFNIQYAVLDPSANPLGIQLSRARSLYVQ